MQKHMIAISSLLPRRMLPIERKRTQAFHQSHRADNQLIIGGAAMLGTAITFRYALAAYQTYQQSKPVVSVMPEDASREEAKDEQRTKTRGRNESCADSGASARSQEQGARQEATSSSGGGMFSSWFARNYYDGGFEEKMSRREAALILGVRETATVERIKEAHRRVLILNHPDKGGSVFVSAKVNEAKDILLKGRQ
jgi:DnaJ family protein C protein 19